MCKLKVGDKFKVIEASGFHRFNYGDIVKLINNDGSENVFCERLKDKTTQYIHFSHLYYIGSYEDSNRFKLKKAIKETGFSSRKLSNFAVGNESFFYNQTGLSRFNSRGDITEDRLNSLLTTLAFAERKLLGVGAKTVDDNPIIDKTIQSESSDEIDLDLKEAIKESEINDQNKLYSEYFDSANKRIQQKKDAKVRNFLIVFLVFVVILSIYFFTR